MAYCQICGRRGQIGRIARHRRGVASRKFAKRAPKKSRRFGANLQKTTFYINGRRITVVVCTRCLKKLRQASLAEKIKLLQKAVGPISVKKPAKKAKAPAVKTAKKEKKEEKKEKTVKKKKAVEKKKPAKKKKNAQK